MKRTFKLILISVLNTLCCSISIAQSGNLLQNGNFEIFDTATCCSMALASCSPLSRTVHTAFYSNCLASTGWYNSHGTADIAVNECIYLESGGTVGGIPCDSYNAQMNAVSGNSEGVYYDKNLSLSPNKVYTLKLYVWSNSGNAETAYIKLANGLTSGNNGSLPAAQTQTIYSNNFTNTHPVEVIIDFVPNDTYHQVWFYLSNTGSFNIDEITLTEKEMYAGINIITAPCCGEPVIYTNTVLPTSVINKEYITTSSSVTISNSSNTILQSGIFIRFGAGTTLNSSSSNYATASIVACKPKPFSDGLFGAGQNITALNCDIYPYPEIGGSMPQKGVTYSWSASPSSGLTYLNNLSATKAIIAPVIPNNTSITYTLTASNSCGSRSSSMTYTHTGSCTNSRIGSIEDELPADVENVMLYPNPTTGSFTISIQFEEKLLTTYSIYNNLGNEVYNRSLGKIKSLEENIELNLPDGLYMVIVSHGNKTSHQRILISQ